MLSATALPAQGRIVLPEGSVIIVRTTTPLESSTAQPGQTFETIVGEEVAADEYAVIPAGSRIRGVVTFAQPANRQQSGVIEVNFDRLTLPGGVSYPLNAKLTSTDAAERRQIDADPDARVVLVGGRGGVGATIAGAGSQRSPTSGILAALGNMLSQARDVRVPAGTPLAVQLEQGLTLSRRGAMRSSNGSTLFTAAERIRAAQQALARLNYYRGPATGQLDDATQRALFEFQVDKGIMATGNLDGRTAAALGISGNAGGAAGGAVLSAEEASMVRRASQALVTRYRQELLVSTNGQFDARRPYTQVELDLLFALSGFADNATLYEQLVRVSGNVAGAEAAGKALIGAARRVDAAMQAGPPPQIRGAWSSIRAQLAELDPGYRSRLGPVELKGLTRSQRSQRR
ncbi:MAG: peptidoglycan-binding protein [Longimicrobiaceae bacterium]